MTRPSNYGTNIEPNYKMYVHPELFNHKAWRTYNDGYLITNIGIRDFILEMAVITNLAYSYHVSGEEVYQISPFYIASLYKPMDWKSCLNSISNLRRTSHALKTSRMLKDYLVMEERGRFGRSPKNGQRVYVYSKYRVTDKLKELAKTLESSVLWNVSVEAFQKGIEANEMRIPTQKKLYIVNTHEGELSFESLASSRRWCEAHSEEGNYTPIQVKTPDIMVRKNTVSKDSYAFVHSNGGREDVAYNPSVEASLSNTAVVNRDAVERILIDPSSGNKYTHFVMKELMRIYNETTDSNPRVELKYFESRQGRHYVQGSAVQLFPKELRESVFSDYVAVDMECSIFALYKNLGKKYGYKKTTPQIDEMIRDRRLYRDKFVTSRLPYDGVKTVLTAIAYGAVVDVYNMYMEASAMGRSRRRSSLLSLGYDRMSVVDMCNSEKILSLTKELRSLGKFIISKCTDKERKCIVNLCGNELSTKERHNFGAKMAHIYQSYEGAILKELQNVKLDGRRLCEHKDGIGLFLHDGLYVNKTLARKYDLCELFSKHIKEVFDFDIAYEVE